MQSCSNGAPKEDDAVRRKLLTQVRLGGGQRRIASLLLVGMPGAPSSFLLLVAMPGAPSSFLFLVVRPGARSSVLAPTSNGLCVSCS